MDAEIKKMFEVITNHYETASNWEDATTQFSTQQICDSINEHGNVSLTNKQVYECMIELGFVFDIIASTLEYVWLLKEKN